MEIKKIEGDDLPPAATLLRNYWKERGMDCTQEWTLSYLANGHKSEIKKDQFFVIRENNKVLGTIALVINISDVAEIRDFVVKKEMRGKGLGKKLLEYVMEYAKQNEVRKIYALIFQPYRLFYEKYEFQLEGFLKDHFKENEHVLIMSKMLKKKEDKQVDLKQKLETEQRVQEIEAETSDRLQKLRLRK